MPGECSVLRYLESLFRGSCNSFRFAEGGPPTPGNAIVATTRALILDPSFTSVPFNPIRASTWTSTCTLLGGPRRSLAEGGHEGVGAAQQRVDQRLRRPLQRTRGEVGGRGRPALALNVRVWLFLYFCGAALLVRFPRRQRRVELRRR